MNTNKSEPPSHDATAGRPVASPTLQLPPSPAAEIDYDYEHEHE
ncbi:MAG TPA: hypothetical protein VIW21_00935 [Chthoniobacterales bacterium]|jgi:hypothetical protein